MGVMSDDHVAREDLHEHNKAGRAEQLACFQDKMDAAIANGDLPDIEQITDDCTRIGAVRNGDSQTNIEMTGPILTIQIEGSENRYEQDISDHIHLDGENVQLDIAAIQQEMIANGISPDIADIAGQALGDAVGGLNEILDGQSATLEGPDGDLSIDIQTYDTPVM